MTHALKTWPELFAAMADGSKTADVRKNDRNYQVGDDLILQEFDPKERKYSGNELKTTITHVLKGGDFGIGKHFAVLSFKRIDAAKRDVVQFVKGDEEVTVAGNRPNILEGPVQNYSNRPDDIALVQEIAPTVHEQPQQPQTGGDLPL